MRAEHREGGMMTTEVPVPANRLMAAIAVSLLVVGAGFSSGETPDDDATQDDDDSAEAMAEILSTYPEDGATDAYYRTDIEICFDRAVGTVTITLVEDAGTAIGGDLTVDQDDMRSTFKPFGDDEAGHLNPLTSHTATITWDDHEPVELHFQTSDLGTPVLDNQLLVDGDYGLDLKTGTFTDASFMGTMFESYYPETLMGIHVEAITGTEIQVYGGAVTAGDGNHIQNLCHPTISFTSEDGEPGPGLFVDPYLHIGPQDVSTNPWGYENVLSDVEIGGSFAVEGDTLAEGTFEGLYDLWSYEFELGWICNCEIVNSLGIDCVECPDGSGPCCVVFSGRNFPAGRVEVTGTHPETGEQTIGLTEVTTEMVAAWETGGFCP